MSKAHKYTMTWSVVLTHKKGLVVDDPGVDDALLHKFLDALLDAAAQNELMGSDIGTLYLKHSEGYEVGEAFWDDEEMVGQGEMVISEYEFAAGRV